MLHSSSLIGISNVVISQPIQSIFRGALENSKVDLGKGFQGQPRIYYAMDILVLCYYFVSTYPIAWKVVWFLLKQQNLYSR